RAARDRRRRRAGERQGALRRARSVARRSAAARNAAVGGGASAEAGRVGQARRRGVRPGRGGRRRPAAPPQRPGPVGRAADRHARGRWRLKERTRAMDEKSSSTTQEPQPAARDEQEGSPPLFGTSPTAGWGDLDDLAVGGGFAGEKEGV